MKPIVDYMQWCKYLEAHDRLCHESDRQMQHEMSFTRGPEVDAEGNRLGADGQIDQYDYHGVKREEFGE